MVQLGELCQRRSDGTALLSRGLMAAAHEEFSRWLGLVERSGDPALIIPPLNALATAASLRGELDEAWCHLKRAQIYASDPSASLVDRIKVLVNLIRVQTDLGLLENALETAAMVQQLSLDQEPAICLIYWVQLSALHWRRQAWVPMRKSSNTAYRMGQALNDPVTTVKALLNRGLAHLELGAHRLAKRDLTETLRHSTQLDPASVAYAHSELGRLHFLRGDYKEALEAGREALAVLLTHVALLDKEEVARISRLFGAICASYGQRNLALKYLNRAAAYFSQLGLRPDWQRCTEMIGELLVAPIRGGKYQPMPDVQQLDFLTAVLDLTDDMESVDPFFRGHSERVAYLAVLLGQEIGLSPEQVHTLSYAARLHDVGMVAVDAELIHRDGCLTESERKRVAMHCGIGAEMLRPHGLSLAGQEAIRHHHEQFNGLGYPDGLSGEAIPLLARVIAVVDVYDALTSFRPYRQALTHSEAMAAIGKMAGIELDSILVDRFIHIHRV